MSQVSVQSVSVRWGAWLSLLVLGNCVEPYMPEVVSAPASYLVVDGFINGNGRTRIKLSRSVDVGAATIPPAQKGAVISIVDDTGFRYALTETAAGLYQSDSLQLNSSRQYHLRLSLGTGTTTATYESTPVAMEVTPPFDKLELVRQNGQVALQLSTHDPTKQAHYYRWRYAETWEFNSAYKSVIECRYDIIQRRQVPIYTCWHTENPSTIRQASTASLSQDALTDFSLFNFSDRSERVKIRYSVLVTQYAETAAEFAYNELLRKNTEAVGTVNDPLPVQLTGNVHRLGNAAEPVLGFVGAHTVVQRRLFATPQTVGLPRDWNFEDPYAACATGVELAPDPGDKYPIYVPHTRIFISDVVYPIDYYYGPAGGDTIGYIGSSRFCVDCTLRGSNVKPNFW